MYNFFSTHLNLKEKGELFFAKRTCCGRFCYYKRYIYAVQVLGAKGYICKRLD